jgi:hypothetical protein
MNRSSPSGRFSARVPAGPPVRRARELRPRATALRAVCTHPIGRAFPDPLVREMLRAFGIVTCPDCGQALRILGRRRR